MRTISIKRLFVLVILGLVQWTAGATNLAINPGMEGPAGDHLPPGWETEVIGIAPKFSTDAQTRHGGASSVRIQATIPTRSYVLGNVIQVAPGQRISASAWVRCENVVGGSVIVLARFARADGHGSVLAKFGNADPSKSGWQEVKGHVIVPPNVTTMRLRMGLSYSRGTIWFDDVRLWTDQSLVARMEQLHGRLSPGMERMPIMIINRGKERASDLQVELLYSPQAPDDNPDAARPSPRIIDEAMKAANQSDAQIHSKQIQLTGEPEQNLSLPLSVPAQGSGTLFVVLLRAKQPIFAGYQIVHVANPLVLQPPLPTHWVIEDGRPHFDGRVVLAVSQQALRGGVLRIKVVDPSGSVFGTWSSAGKLSDGRIDYSISAPNAKVGKYKVIAEFTPGAGKPIRAEEHWGVIPRKLAEVKLNSAGYPVYDDHAIFPLGMFNGTLWDGLQAGGFTVSHAYNAVNTTAFEPPDDLAAQKFLDKTEKHGMKALFLIPRGYVFAGQWDAFRRRIDMFKNHPALLAWDEEEGIARGDLSPAGLAKMVRIIRQEDPYHPIMIGDSRTVISQVKDRSDFFPVKLMDMGMWWWYPFPLKNLPAGALEGDEGTSASELVLPTFLTRANTNKPLWVGIQSYRKGKNLPYPTPAEYRAQAYAAICAGAKGLMWYGGGVRGGLQGDSAAAHWKYLQQLVREIRGNADFWMEPVTIKPKFQPAGIPFSAIMKKHAGRTIVLAVNRSTRAVDVTLSVPSLSGQAEVLGEHRQKRVEDGQITDHFGPMAVHVYEIR